jgi:hypothetical protein
MVEVAERGKEGMLLDFGLMEILLLETILVKPPLELVLTGGVLMLALAPTGVVVVLAGLHLAFHLAAVGDEVIRVSIIEPTILDHTMPPI